MKIDVLSQIYLPEPAGVFTSDLVDRWASNGHEVTVWTASQSLPEGRAKIVRLAPSAGYDRRSLLARATSQVSYCARTAARFALSQISGSPPDVLVVMGSPALSSVVPAALPMGARCRVIQWVHDLYPEALLALRPRWSNVHVVSGLVEGALNRAWRRADVVIAVSPQMAARVQSRVPTANVKMIPLWARDEIVPRADRAPRMREARGIPTNAFVVTYHGNLGLAYDFAPLLEAAHHLVSHPEIIVAIVGAGAQLRSLERQIASEHLTNVRLFPPVSVNDLPDSLAMGDCHVIGVREGWSGVAFPTKFISAVAAGRPVLVVGPPGDELPDLVSESGCGTVVAPQANHVASALIRLCGHPELAAVQGAAGRRLYEARFDRQMGLGRWDALLGDEAP